MQPLRETLAGTDTLEGRAAFLLRAVAVPAPLSSAAVQRIGVRLPLAPVAGSRSRMLPWPVGLLLPAALALGSLVALHRTPPHEQIAPAAAARQVAVEQPTPADGTVVVASPTSVGPAAASPSPVAAARVRARPRPTAELEEATLLRRILELAESPAGAIQALEALSDYRRRFPTGMLRREADLAEVRADMALGHREEAIETLDRLLSQSDPPRATALALLRGELLTREGRCADALASWGSLTVQSAAEKERLLHGRAFCLATLGRWSESQAVYRAYLKAFPEGRFAGEARVALSGWDAEVDE
jgi:tetratricopeptide (TPR) repeat protein